MKSKKLPQDDTAAAFSSCNDFEMRRIYYIYKTVTQM